MLSVVIPVKDRADIVQRTLDSLSAQTVQPEAIYLVDNGSTDGTLEVLHNYAHGRAHVRVLSEPRPGAAEARNCGLNQVQTPYVLFFDSDDVMPPRHIEQISERLRRPNAPQILYFAADIHELNGKVSHKAARRGDAMFNQVFHSILSTQRCVVSTDLLRSIGGWPEQTPVWDDYLLGVRLLATGATCEPLGLATPVQIYAQAMSITGTDFASRAGKWEAVLNAIEAELTGTKYARLVAYRRAILAGFYRKEHRPDLARPLTKTLKQRLIARYVALGGRGVALLAKYGAGC